MGRHEKSRKHSNIPCEHFLRKLWTFLQKLQISDSTFKLMSTTLHYYQQLVHFDANYSIKVTKIIIYVIFQLGIQILLKLVIMSVEVELNYYCAPSFHQGDAMWQIDCSEKDCYALCVLATQ